MGFLDQNTEPVWEQFSKTKYSNVWHVHGNGHHYDVTTKCYGVIVTKSLVKWMLNFSEINVVFCSFEKLLGF